MGYIDTAKWRDFMICDIFEVKNTHSILAKNVVFGSGNHPYVTASEKNNSVVAYIDYDESQIEVGNSIVIGGKTMAITYQPVAYFSNDSHNLSLVLKDKKHQNKYIQLFMVTALKAGIGNNYSWGDSISSRSIKRDMITLPVLANGDIDWDYMESYIKIKETEVRAKITALKKLLG